MEGRSIPKMSKLDGADEQPAFSLRGLAATARRQALWIGGAAALVAAFTIAFTLRQKPVYEARATLRLAEQPGQSNPADLLTALSAPSTIETEIEILRSRTVAEDVVDSLGLNVFVVDPKGLWPSALFRALQGSRGAVPGIYLVRRDTVGFSVTAPDGREIHGSYGTPVVAGRMQIEPLPPRMSESGESRIELSVGPAGAAAEGLRQGLRVSRPQANAGIVSVTYQSTVPVLASAVVNAVAQSYIAHRNQIQKQQARTAVSFLRGQVQTIGAELRQAESALERFRRARFVIDPEAQAGEQVRRLAELRAQREELSAERSELRDLLTRTRQPTESAADWAAFVGAPALIKNQAIASIVQQLSTMEAERARLLTWRTAADPDVLGLERTIALLRTRLDALAASSLQGLDDQARSLDSTLARFDAQLQRVPEVQLQYARLRRQVDLHTQLYTLLQTRLKEAEISEAVEIANIQVVDPAVTPWAPVGGRRLFNVAFGTAVGLLLGVLVALVREGTDTRVRSREEIVRLTELPLLAAIPRIDLANGRRKGKEVAEQIEDRLVIRHSPRSAAAEAYRALRTNIAFSSTSAKRPLKTLVITSPEPQDGKTTTAANLAITLAEQGLRAMLVAADLRRPVLHKVLHTDRAPGLSDVLGGTAPIESVIQAIPLLEHASGTLAFIPAGRAVPNPAELLGSAAMKSLLATLAGRYDAVVLDTPPLSVVTDAAVLGTIADGVVFVARMGATHGEELRRSVEELQGIGARVVGTVLTDVHHAEDRYGYRYGYYDYYDEADGRGGKKK